MEVPSPAPLTEGEVWAREQLQLLLSARFGPRAVAGFFGASQRRANDVRARRPALARQSRAWIGLGAALWTTLGLAGVEPFRGRLRAGLLWWASTALMLDWHLGMLETPEGKPRAMSTADALTLTRVWLAPAALEQPTALICCVGFATDVLDGQAARRLGEPTRAGRDLEGLADLCFAAAVLLGLRRSGRVGAAASAAELTRVGVGFAYALGVYFGRAEAPDPELTRAARLTTPVRAGGLIVAATGRRRLGTALVGAGCVASLALLFRTAGSRPGRSPTPSRR
ncbi:MAG: CDP-alcohol phosphatidyltransferase family protein [Thermoleophilaceae bacterium]